MTSEVCPYWAAKPETDRVGWQPPCTAASSPPRLRPRRMNETCSGVSEGTLPNGDASLRTEGPMPWATATLPGEADAPLDTVRATTGMTAAAAAAPIRRRL